MMALYDELPLGVPTLIGQEGDFDIWATRTENGGTVENRIRPGTNAERSQQIEDRITQALSVNATFLGLASPTNAQVVAQTKALTRQVSAIIRLMRGDFSSVD